MDKSIIKEVEIVSVIHETADARTLVLKPLHGWQPRYKAGQFLTLIFNTPGGEKRRSYSISSCPDTGEPLSITVKKIDNGEFSRWLVYKANPGDILSTSGVGGFFVLPENVQGKTFCFLAAGSGITPCFSLIKTLLLTTSQDVFLFYSNKSEKDTIFLKPLQDLMQQYPHRFHIHFMYSDRLDVYNSRMSNMVLNWLFDKHFAHRDKSSLLFYICGPFDYKLMAMISLHNNGISDKQIFKEDFSTLPPVRLPEPPDKDMHKVTLHLHGKVHVIEVQYPKSITASARDQHINMPYSCEAGRCGSCVATCISGKVWMAYNEVLMDEEIERGRVLTCQGYPIGGDVELVFE